MENEPLKTRHEPQTPATTPAAHPLERYLGPIEALLDRIVSHGRFELKFEVRQADPADLDEFEVHEVLVDFSGPDSDLLLEANGALLDALEYVVMKAVRLEEDLFGKITFDCHGWRRSRIEELKLTAQLAADRVSETGEAFSLGPMPPRERRIVHLALRSRPAVRTTSEGYGADRKVIVLPASSSGGAPPRPR